LFHLRRMRGKTIFTRRASIWSEDGHWQNYYSSAGY
jgi:hypothetical protein